MMREIGAAESAEDVCGRVLESTSSRHVAQVLRTLGVDPLQLLGGLLDGPGTQAAGILERTRTSASLEPGAVEHYLLVRAAQTNVSAVHTLPISDTSKADLRAAFVRLAEPIPTLREKLRWGHSWFMSAAKMVMLRRFPAGAFEWEVSGVPRSWLLKVRGLPRLRLIRVLLVETRGLHPFLSPHLSILREPGARLDGASALKGYVEMARALELQPEVKGMVAASWLRDPCLRTISPHLYEVVTAPVVQGGGFVADLGAVDPVRSGALTKSRTRRLLFEAGKYVPRAGMAVWPRREMLAWLMRAADHALQQ